MRPKSLLLLTLALGCGLVASIGISQVLDRKGWQGPAAAETEAIYIAKTNINLGDKLDEEVLNLEDWPKDKIPPGAIRNLEDLLDRHPRTKIYQGEPILEVKLISADARDNPAEQVPQGYRVVSVRVDVHTGGAGLLRPGDRVDVQMYVKRNRSTGMSVTKTKTILREIRVFAVDQDFRRATDDEEASPARTVSLVVTPEQADKLTLASKLGEINLIMRNPDDQGNPNLDGASIEDLFVSSHGDRKKERVSPITSAAPPRSGFLQFIKQLGKVTPTANSPPTQVAAAPWTMLVMEGSDVREVQLKQQDGSPLWVTGADGTGADYGTAPGAMPTSAGPLSDTSSDPDTSAAPAAGNDDGSDDDVQEDVGQDDSDETFNDLLGGTEGQELPIFTGGDSD